MKYEATYAFNLRRFVKFDIEASSPDEARTLASSFAWPTINADIEKFQNTDGFADTDSLDAWLMLDTADGDVIAEVPLDEPEPEPKPLGGEQFGTMPDGSPSIILG